MTPLEETVSKHKTQFSRTIIITFIHLRSVPVTCPLPYSVTQPWVVLAGVVIFRVFLRLSCERVQRLSHLRVTIYPEQWLSVLYS